jgi:hypothetical protein
MYTNMLSIHLIIRHFDVDTTLVHHGVNVHAIQMALQG